MNIIVLSLLLLFFTLSSAHAAECVYINSYHVGYAWSDKLEHALKRELQGQCNLHTFYMDTKRHPDATFAEKKAMEAKALIEQVKPDVVIASDDNASKYLVAPYYKNSPTPFVFCGINWTADAYDYPYANATGMIEVSPIKDLLYEARMTLKEVRSVAFIAVRGMRTDEKEFEWMARIYAREGVIVTPLYVQNMQEWEQAYSQAQASDLIVLNNIAGLADWNHAEAVRYILQHSHQLTVTTYDFMAPYTILAMTKLAEEQGEWAGQVAIHLLHGDQPSSIPVVANRHYNLYLNETILATTALQILPFTRFNAIKVQP